VDDYILVSENEIKQAIISLIQTQHLLVEGASGVALAALLKYAHQFQGKNLTAVLSGGNISLPVLKTLLD
jgi:threonine dehydratase